MILSKEVEVKLWGKNIKYYNDLGYNGKQGDIVVVKVEDLQKNSHVEVEVLCDFCNENKMLVKYSDYNRIIEKSGSYVCKQCAYEKIRQTSLERFGVSSYAQTKECQEKIEQTMKLRYGYNRALQNPESKKRFRETCEERYGEDYGNVFIEKAMNTFYEKTGYHYPSQSPDVRKKIIESNLKHYNVDNPKKAIEVKEKIAQTFYANSSQKASKQQRYICNLYQGVLNYPISYYHADIYLPNDNLIIEYDGGGHLLEVAIGHEPMEKHVHKEIVRDNVLKNKGYKQMRIISVKDKLPSDDMLLKMLLIAKEYLLNTFHSWISFDIDNSKMINAENKDIGGVFFDYGKLRKIKEITHINT